MRQGITPGFWPNRREEHEMRRFPSDEVLNFGLLIATRNEGLAGFEQALVIFAVADDDEFEKQLSGSGVARAAEEDLISLVNADGTDDRDTGRPGGPGW